MAKEDIANQVSKEQQQTAETFGYKWGKRDSYESDALSERHGKWLVERYCQGSPDIIEKWFEGESKVILDAGCGAAFSALILFGAHLSSNEYIGIDISDSVKVAEERFVDAGYPGQFHKCDLMQAPVEDGSVDIIFSEGVLHHTDSVEESIIALARKLKSGGRFMFYVYRSKGPIREFSDDYIREQIREMDNDAAWEALRPLTKLGNALGELGVSVTIPEDIPLLGIEKGTVDVQRLFYWHVCKMFYDSHLSLEEMNHINFDWYRPLNCIRSTPDQVRKYCEKACLVIETMDVQPAGITVVAVKK